MPRESKYKPGMQFGKWKLIERDLSIKRPVRFICRCECGTTKSNVVTNLKTGLSTQCTKCMSLSRSKYMIGKKYGALTVLSLEKVDGKCHAEVLCTCGNIRYLMPGSFSSGKYKNCGRCYYDFKKEFKVGLLTVKKRLENKKYLCICDCGNEFHATPEQLRSKIPSCGCYYKNKRNEKAKEKVGLGWGYLKIKKFLGIKREKGDKRSWYLLKCKCGKEFEKEVGHLFDIQSCGCKHIESMPRGERNHKSKLSDSEVKAMREIFKSGLYYRKEIAEMMNISYFHACSILSGKVWKHLIN